jgi:hypothetical protein
MELLCRQLGLQLSEESPRNQLQVEQDKQVVTKDV